MAVNGRIGPRTGALREILWRDLIEELAELLDLLLVLLGLEEHPGLVEDGRLLPQSERLIAHFQALVVDALA